MTTPKPDPDYGTNKMAIQKPRTYQIPGGPYARNLGKTAEPKVLLAETTRGGPNDGGYGSKR
jgi:hypothetical protein